MTLKIHTNDVQQQIDEKYMRRALALASKSEALGEVPIGALIVDKNGKVLAQSTNLRETVSSVLGHAELIVLHRASRKLKSWRLVGCTLYVTLEPCLMCAAALIQARVSRVVFATADPKGGGVGSLHDFSKDSRLNHQFHVTRGIYQEESQKLLKNFFKLRRKKK